MAVELISAKSLELEFPTNIPSGSLIQFEESRVHGIVVKIDVEYYILIITSLPNERRPIRGERCLVTPIKSDPEVVAKVKENL